MPDRHYDVVFAGFGASACILIHQLHSSGWLKEKKILIVEPSEKKTNDRTFCFWAKPDSDLVKQFQPAISHSWQNISFNGTISSISPLCYHHIRGSDLYQYTREVLDLYQPDWHHESVEEILSAVDLIQIKLSEGLISANLCFDSRTPVSPAVQFPEIAIHQTFLGFRVKLRHPAPDSDHATLMDFDIDQEDSTQFIYRLLFKSDELLVELTRFGEEKIDPVTAAPTLEHYIRKQYGQFEILETEYGCIPMIYTDRTEERGHRIISLGTRAGRVKPSTGYAFKNMFNHAVEISAALKSGSHNLHFTQPESRFRFYDHLLLIILKSWPQEGRKIFDQLLSRVPARQVLTFLDERTSISEEISIFSKLPVLLFLKAWVIKEFHSNTKHKTEWFVLISTILATVTGSLFPGALNYFVWPILIIGLILVGIPHGAVDDMIKTDGTLRKIDFRFISGYLFQSAIMLAWWWLHPPTALLAFLIYSAWHFGQADAVESGITSTGITGKFNIIVQGAGTLCVILLSHVTELNSILDELNIPLIAGGWGLLAYGIMGLLFLHGIVHANRKLIIGYLTLAISFQLPLLMAFGIYFIFQHSLRGWSHIRSKFQKTDIELFRAALPFHLGAWLMLGLIYWILKSWPPQNSGFGLIGIFFIFLSSLSFPHVLAMDGFYRRKFSDS